MIFSFKAFSKKVSHSDLFSVLEEEGCVVCDTKNAVTDREMTLKTRVFIIFPLLFKERLESHVIKLAI